MYKNKIILLAGFFLLINGCVSQQFKESEGYTQAQQSLTIYKNFKESFKFQETTLFWMVTYIPFYSNELSWSWNGKEQRVKKYYCGAAFDDKDSDGSFCIFKDKESSMVNSPFHNPDKMKQFILNKVLEKNPEADSIVESPKYTLECNEQKFQLPPLLIIASYYYKRTSDCSLTVSGYLAKVTIGATVSRILNNEHPPGVIIPGARRISKN